jgi:hypothetical protein
MPDVTPSFQDLTPAPVPEADVGSWYYTSSVPGVPDTVAPFLAAHGFLVVGGGPYEIDGEFAGFLLNMRRQTFSHADATQVLLNAEVFAYNEGRTLNDRRYEDLVSNLSTLLGNHQTDITSFINNNVTGIGGYGYVSLVLSNISLLLTDHQTFEADIYSYDTGDRDTELTRLKTIWQDAATTLEAEYATMTAGLDIPGLIAQVQVAIDALDAALTRFNDETSGLAATLLADFTSHEATATAFLTGLGTTELARINERFDNLLASNNQLLANRGFYSSAIPTQMTVQVERERNEAIGELNDRLNREKFENQHRLYEQKYRMRLGTLDVSFKALEGATTVLQARLAHGQWASRIRHEVATLSINAKLALLGLREKYYTFLLQSIDWQTERRMKIYENLFRVRLESMRIRQSVGQFHSELIKYQVDSRNQLALAMFGFVERREDDYPGLGDIAATVASLGDSD